MQCKTVGRKEKMTTKKDKHPSSILAFAIILPSIAILLLIWGFTNGSESHTSTITTNNLKTSSLVCKSNYPKNPFFNDSAAINTQHEIRVLLNDDRLSKIFYIYSAVYDSAKQADYYNSIMAADYNKYLSGHNTPLNILSKTFSTSDNESKITIYSNVDKINSVTANIFLLDANNNYNKDNNTSADIKKLYENQGFSCEINE